MHPLRDLRTAFDAHCLADPDTEERVVTAAGAEAALFRLGIAPAAGDLRDAMEFAGVDDTGCVGWDGFKQLYQAFHKSALDPLEVVKRFMILDTERTGQVSREAFLAASEGTVSGAERVWASIVRAPAADQPPFDNISALEMAVAMVPSPDVKELEELIIVKYGISVSGAQQPAPPQSNVGEGGRTGGVLVRRRRSKSTHPALRLGAIPRKAAPARPKPEADEVAILPSIAPVPDRDPTPVRDPTPEAQPDPAAAEPEGDDDGAAAACTADTEPEESTVPAAAAVPADRSGEREAAQQKQQKAPEPEPKEQEPLPPKEEEKKGGCCIVA